MNSPKVTIIFGTYRIPDLIVPSLDALLNSTFQDFVIYIIDDNPPGEKNVIEETRRLVDKYNDSRIHLIKNDINIGVPYVFRKWIEYVKTPYFIFFGAGDKLEPDSLGDMIKFLQNKPTASFVFGLEYFENASKQRREIRKKKLETGLYKPNEFLEYHITGKGECMGWSQASAMYRTEFFRYKNIPVTNNHYWDHYFHCAYLLFSKEIGFVKKYLALRHVDESLPEWARKNEFTDKVERLIQTDRFLSEYEITLLQQNYPVIKYRLINSINLIKSIPFCGNFNQFYLGVSIAISTITKITLCGIFYLPFPFIRKIFRAAKGLR